MDQVEGQLRRGIVVKLVLLCLGDEVVRADKVFKASLVFEKHIDWRTDKFVEVLFCEIAVLVVKEVRVVLEALSSLLKFGRELSDGLKIVKSHIFASNLRFLNEFKSGF